METKRGDLGLWKFRVARGAFKQCSIGAKQYLEGHG